MIFSEAIEKETAVMLLATLGRICASTQKLCIAKKEEMLLFTLFYVSRKVDNNYYRSFLETSKPSKLHGISC